MEIARVGVSVLLFNRGKILLAERISTHENGKFGTPGGKVDYGETPDVTIARELLEETGLHIGLQALGFITNCIYPDEGNHFLCLWFYGNLQADVDSKIDFVEKDSNGNPKCKGWDWYSFEQLSRLPLMLGIEEAYLHYLSNRNHFRLVNMCRDKDGDVVYPHHYSKLEWLTERCKDLGVELKHVDDRFAICIPNEKKVVHFFDSLDEISGWLRGLFDVYEERFMFREAIKGSITVGAETIPAKTETKLVLTIHPKFKKIIEDQVVEEHGLAHR